MFQRPRGSIYQAQVVAEACSKLETGGEATRTEAESVLLEFRRQGRPYNACKHILTESTNATAQFHAVATLKEAVIRSR